MTMQWWWGEANQSDSHTPRLMVMVRWCFQHCLIFRTCWTLGCSQIAIIQVCLWSKFWSHCLLKYSQSVCLTKININITNISNLLTQNNPPVILVVLWVCGRRSENCDLYKQINKNVKTRKNRNELNLNVFS